MRGDPQSEPDIGGAGGFGLPAPESAAASSPRWRFLVLARVANYQLLRRNLGRERLRALMIETARRVEALTPGGRAAATGPDLIELSFAADSRDAVEAALARIGRVLAEPVEMDGERHDVELFFGAAASDGPPSDDVRMVELAEQALADAGAERRAVVRDDGADQRVDRIALAHDLTEAVARGELFLNYQPKVHLRSQKVTSVEALIRWRHPARGLVLPGDFIPLAEETRAITAMTLWTIRQALADQAVLAGHGHDLRVFVNISGVLLGDSAFVAQAAELVRGDARRIGFEVTETSVIRDPEVAIANLRTLADLGVHIAIDDYGAGLSSLAYLKRLPACELKIDKLFVTQLTSTNRDPLIVRSTIDLAHALEMEVVAEGVETQAALALLSVMGCDMAQGFLISRPIGLDALISFLADGQYAHTVEESRATFNRLAALWKRG